MSNRVLVIGSNKAGLRAARDLADAGLSVDLVEKGPFLVGARENSQPDFLENTRLLEILKDPGIKVWTNTQILNIRKEGAGYRAELSCSPRYIDLDRCTACGDCLDVCPINIPGSDLKAIHFGGQPDCAVIEKSGISPCSDACPAGIHVQGYVALINQGKYQQAYQLIQNDLPFPSVCGRVCNHLCETACSRSQLDDAVNLMALKRFVADWTYDHKDQNPTADPGIRDETGKSVAIIGAGPTGLTAARDLVRLGHKVKIFDANPEPGGMMRVGIPPHRLDYDKLAWEIDLILQEGIELQLNTWIDDIPSLLSGDYDAVLAATGACRAIKPKLENTDHKDNWLSLEFLKKVSLGEKIDLSGRDVIVLGGGDVAMDAARAALRLGPDKVKIVCRGLRASAHELSAVEMEGIEIIPNRVFRTVEVERKKIKGVECLEAEVGDVDNGKRQFKELPGTEHIIPGNLVIWALGQKVDGSFLPEVPGLVEEGSDRIDTDQEGKTHLEGLFAAGDFRLGNTSFVVDAVGEGHRVARSIHRYLMDIVDDPAPTARDVVLLDPDEMRNRLEGRKKARAERQEIPLLSVNKRINNFLEVDLPLGEKDALLESNRCLICGPCSECMECVEVCEPNAIIHDQTPYQTAVQTEKVILPEGFSLQEDLPGCYPYAAEVEISGSAAAYQVILAEQAGWKPVGQVLRTESRNGEHVGLVVCQCADQISKYVNTVQLCKEAIKWPEVDFATEIRVSCSTQGSEELKKIILRENLDKLILAACSCCSLDQVCFSCTYQRTRCKENLGVFTPLEQLAHIEFINIREQSAWVHRRSRKKATTSARNLIRTALGRFPVQHPILPVSDGNLPTVLLVGQGNVAAACGNFLNELGIGVVFQDVLSDFILRRGGKYHTEIGEEIFQADGLIVAPGSGAELEHLLGMIVLANHQPILSTDDDVEGSRGHYLLICPPDGDPATIAAGTAARMYAWLRQTYFQVNPRSAVIDQARCRSCATCQEVCGLGIPEIIQEDSKSFARINPYLCQDCGLCTAHCPSGAIQPGSDQVEEMDLILEMLSS